MSNLEKMNERLYELAVDASAKDAKLLMSSAIILLEQEDLLKSNEAEIKELYVSNGLLKAQIKTIKDQAFILYNLCTMAGDINIYSDIPKDFTAHFNKSMAEGDPAYIKKKRVKIVKDLK